MNEIVMKRFLYYLGMHEKLDYNTKLSISTAASYNNPRKKISRYNVLRIHT